MTIARPLLSLAAALACALAGPGRAATPEAQVKADYLFKLASFVRWPAAAFADPGAPLRICVADRPDVQSAVEALARGQAASDRRLATALIDPAEPGTAADCQILFVGADTAPARTLLADAAQRPVLTVTDRSTSLRGGILEFVPAEDGVRFVVHRGAAEVRQLILSSKLLAVAAAVEP